MVIGARERSLGEAICVALENAGYTAIPAGVSGEGVKLDVQAMSVDVLSNVFNASKPHHVICTVGMNDPWFTGLDLPSWYANHLVLNCIGPMKVVEAFQHYAEAPGNRQRTEYQHAVVISSNSARIPRTNSAAYCASKAALSMAVRCKARELGRAGSVVLAYGYEPGLLGGTPMTESVGEDLAGVPLHRMPGVGPKGLTPARVANMVVQNLEGGRELNGCLYPVDAGEL